MEKFQELREASKRKIKIADHVITQTYPLVQDTKLLISALENLFLGLSYAIGSVLHYERLFKRIPPFSDNFEGKYNMFMEKIMPKYKFNKEYLLMMREIRNLVIEHKRSPMEFVRKDRFIICSNNYRIKTISLDQIKKYINQSKQFIKEIDNVFTEYEHIFTEKALII